MPATAKMLADSTQSDVALEKRRYTDRYDRHRRSKKDDSSYRSHHHSQLRTSNRCSSSTATSSSSSSSSNHRKSHQRHKPSSSTSAPTATSTSTATASSTATSTHKDTESKVAECSEDSDLNLNKALHPISHYINDRGEMLEQMLHCLKGDTLKKALPDILQDVSMKELKQLCLKQLEVMSKKRILRILAGDDPSTISSSATEDESGDETGNNGGNVAARPADSTSSVDRSDFQPVADQSRDIHDADKGVSKISGYYTGITDTASYIPLSGQQRQQQQQQQQQQQLLQQYQLYPNAATYVPTSLQDLRVQSLPTHVHVSPQLLAYQQAMIAKQLDISTPASKLQDRDLLDALGISSNTPKPTSSVEHQASSSLAVATSTVTRDQIIRSDAAQCRAAIASISKKVVPSANEAPQNVIEQTEMEILELGMRARAIKAMLQAASQCNP